MYHRHVRSRPRRVEEIIDDSDADAPGADMIRLSAPGVTGSPAFAAEYRLDRSAWSTPSESHEVGCTARPLSKTDTSRPDDDVATNGAQARPGESGSLVRDMGSGDSLSPTLVPPPGFENTVRPSTASRAPADQYR